jgi:hypothetical protein
MRQIKELRPLPLVPKYRNVFIAGALMDVVFRTEEEKMPVIILWAVPAIIAVGGGIYLISHMH